MDQAVVNWREQRMVEALLMACQLQGGSLLDVPCGYGRFTALFARHGIRVTSADVSGAMVRLARANQVPPASGHWLQADVFNLPFAASAFDGVLSMRLLHQRYSPGDTPKPSSS